MSRGGARPGAGRKAVNGAKVTYTVRVTLITREILREMKAEGISISRIVEGIAETWRVRHLTGGE